MKFIIHTDGGARGNPGPAAVGVVVEIIQNSNFKIQNGNARREEAQIIEISKRIGETTNNVAEYTAVLEALRYLKIKTVNFKLEDNENFEIQFFLDSTLVVNQLNGLFKVKDAKLRALLIEVRSLEQELGLPAGKAGGQIIYTAIPREQNTHADALVNQALDQ